MLEDEAALLAFDLFEVQSRDVLKIRNRFEITFFEPILNNGSRFGSFQQQSSFEVYDVRLIHIDRTRCLGREVFGQVSQDKFKLLVATMSTELHHLRDGVFPGRTSLMKGGRFFRRVALSADAYSGSSTGAVWQIRFR